MEKIVVNPFLPLNRVKKLLIGKAAQGFQNELLYLGFELFFGNSENFLKEPLSGHIDVLANHYGNNSYYIDKSNVGVFNELNKYGINSTVIGENVKNKYPNDAKLNFVRIDDFLLCNSKTVSKEVVERAALDGIKIIDIKQGYTKCSTLIIKQNAVITDDTAIGSALKLNNFDVLTVEKGSVGLPGYNYGFIGGCGGLISKNEMIFFGNIKMHKSYNEIKSFLNNYKINMTSLSGSNLLDVGSIIPLTECED